MAIAQANGIEICYETNGDAADPPLLLVMGFTAQLTAWEDGFVNMLAERGRYVIRFDNRDCGLSTHLDGQKIDLPSRASTDDAPDAPYNLSAFSDDAFGLLDHLEIEQAHIAGASMGGYIVQTMAIEHPERVLSMVSIMSGTREPDYFKSSPEAMAMLLTPPPTNRDTFIEAAATGPALWSSPRYFDPERAKARAAAAFDRSFYPEGAGRQMAAIQASANRSDALRSLKVPTLVIHGAADQLILPMGGQRTADLIPGANLLVLKDMGHDLPEPLWPIIVDAMISHTEHCIG